MHPILDPFEQAVERRPEHPAACDQSLSLSAAALRAVACGLAQRIAAQTEKPRVGILAPGSSVAAVSVLACWYAGRTPVPLNFLLPPADLARIGADADLDLVLAIEHFRPACEAMGINTLLLNATSLAPGRGHAPAVSPDDLGALIYTSGTSGDPKGVRLTFDNLARNAQSAIQHARISPDHTLLSVLPQFHSFGFTAMTVVPLMLGATVWYLPRFSPAAVVSMVQEKQVSIFMAVASMYAALTKMKTADPAALATLRLAISGGEPLSRGVAEQMEQRFGVRVNEGYGLTETSPVVSINVPWKRCPGSVGTAIPGVQVQAVDSSGNALAAGQEGELTIRGHCVMQGYHNKPDATAATIRDGVLYTGDMGCVDAEGFVHITGRIKEMIIVGGENVFPREIENALCEHPAVAEAAVIGVRDELRGEAPLAFVILNDGATADALELRAFCRERLPGYKAPREVRISPELPRGPTGKILKRALLALVDSP